MASRGRHQSTSRQCRKVLLKIERLEAVRGVIIGMSYGGKSLAQGTSTGGLRLQRIEKGGLKAVIQSNKGVQEIFIRTDEGAQEEVAALIEAMLSL